REPEMMDGGGKHRHGARLMSKTERNRYGEQQSPDAERGLQHGEKRERHGTADERLRRPAQREPYKLGERGRDHGIADHAVVELNRKRILEGVEIPGRGLQQPVRDERAIDQGPGVVAQAGVEAGDESAGQQLQEDERKHAAGDDGWRARNRLRWLRSRLPPEREQQPERVAENRERHAEMGGEPVLADISAV